MICVRISLRSHTKKIFLLGDFNLPGVNWEDNTSCTELTPHVNYMRDIILCHNLHQVVTLPTRVYGSSSSILDLVFVNRNVEKLSVSVERGISDHEMVCFSCCLEKCNRSNAKSVVVKDFSRARDETILDYLDFHLSNFKGNNVIELWDRFKELCTYCVQNFVPNKTKKTAKVNPWVTREVIHLKRKIKRWRRKNAL